MQRNKTTTFISLTADSVFKYLFKTKYKWFYRKLIYRYTNIDINEYDLYDNELNLGSKHNKGDLKFDIMLKHKYSNNYINIEMNNYNTLKRNEIYLHILSVFLYNKHFHKTKEIPNIIQININTFHNKAYNHISLKNNKNKIVTKNYPFFESSTGKDIRLCNNSNWMYVNKVQVFLTPAYNDNVNSWITYPDGYVRHMGGASGPGWFVRPSVYLEGNVIVKQDGADGSYDKPYNIELGT